MIVNDLDIGCTFSPSKTNSPLVVDANAILPPPLPLQSLKPIAGRYFEITHPVGSFQHFKLSPCHAFYSLETFDRPVGR